MPQTLHAAVARALSAHGIDTVFGVLGHGNMLIVDDLVENHGARYIAAAREDGGVMMADGFARVSGRLGCATTTFGPSLTNSLTALTEASRNGTRMLVLVGDTPADDPRHRQELDQQAAVAPTGAGFQPVLSARSAWADVALAVRRTHDEGRPIVVNVPEHLQELDVDAEAPTPVWAPPAQRRTPPDEEALDRAVGIIANARRPIVLAGRGAVAADAREALLRLAGRLGAPVANTLFAKDYFRGEPANIGTYGTFGSQAGGKVIAEADCVIAFGAGLNRDTTARGNLIAGKTVVQVDIDPTRIGSWYPVDAAVVGDARTVAARFVACLDEIGAAPTGFAGSAAVAELAGHSFETEWTDHSTDTTVDLRTFVARLDAMLPERRSVTVDAGRFMMAPATYLRVADPRSFLLPVNFGSVGLSMGAAVGAAFGRPDQPSVAVMGDGGFMMNLAEFSAAVRHDRDLIVVVLNDGGYGAEYHALPRHGKRPDISLNAWPDFAPVAEALGGRGLTVRRLADLDTVAAAIAGRDRPLLVDVKVDPALRIGWAE